MEQMTELYAAAKPALMAYCRLDDLSSEDELVLQEAFEAAVSYMEDAGVAVPKRGTPRRAKYNSCINALVLDAWDHRGAQLAGSALVENPAFRRKLNQLKFTEPVSDSDTGSGG